MAVDACDIPLPPYDRLLHEAPAIIYVYDLIEAQSVYQNRELGELLGYRPDDPRSHNWRDLIHPEDAAQFPAHRDKLRQLNAGESLLFEYRMLDANGEWRWMMSRDVPLSFGPAGQVTQILGTATDASERRRSEERQALLARELNHRVKNLLSIVNSIILRTHRTQPPEQFLPTVSARLQALAGAADLLSDESWTEVSLRTVVERILDFLPHLSGRIAIEGPPVKLLPSASLTLALVLHELATNAVKYGALSVASGRITLHWRRDGNEAVLDWTEQDGPPVTPPARKGFGSQLIERVLSEHHAGATTRFEPEGLRCTFNLPILNG